MLIGYLKKMLHKLLFLLSIIFSGLTLGYLLQYIDRKQKDIFLVSRDSLRKNLQKLAIFSLNPISVIGAIWYANLSSSKAIFIPVMGIISFFLGALLSFLAARYLRLSRPATGIYIITGSFSNIGAMGGMICFAFFGEAGYALTPIYNFILPALYFAVGFPVAKYCSNHYQKNENLIAKIVNTLIDPFVFVPVISLTIGLFLNFSEYTRPLFYEKIISFTVPMANFLILVSIGLELRISKVIYYLKECSVLSIIKFLIVPFITSLIACKIGLGEIDSGLPLKVIIVLSSTPVALNALIPPSVYDMELNMVNSCWLFTTFAMIIIIPVQYFVVNLI